MISSRPSKTSQPCASLHPIQAWRCRLLILTVIVAVQVVDGLVVGVEDISEALDDMICDVEELDRLARKRAIKPALFSAAAPGAAVAEDRTAATGGAPEQEGWRFAAAVCDGMVTLEDGSEAPAAMAETDEYTDCKSTITCEVLHTPSLSR